MSNIYKVAILGSTGYTGFELVKILERHPQIEIAYLGSQQHAGKKYREIYPQVQSNLTCINADDDFINNIDVVFFATPNGIAHKHAAKLIAKGIIVIDLSADYRFKNLTTYEHWYGFKRDDIELNSQAVYGLAELNREAIKKTKLIANPGCYTTAAILSLAPLLKYNKEDIDYSSIIIDGKSGISGAGRKAELELLYSELNENAYAYKIANQHRHGPELEAVLAELAGKTNIELCFTPHIIPMTRGMLVTSYVKVKQPKDYKASYHKLYQGEKFVEIIDQCPQSKWVTDTNKALIHVNYDPRLQLLIISTAIDNLIKGASGQAVQNMNLALGLEESLSLL
jgi:N-acetyl-gamma-glutamyl-phosphate reductase